MPEQASPGPEVMRESLSEMERAKAAKYLAEAEFAHEQARAERARAEIGLLELEEQQRTIREKRTADKYHHVYQFNHSVESNSVNSCMKQLVEWTRLAPEEKLDIEVVFHSPGGNVIDGMALFDFLRWLRAQGHHVTTTALGMAASMAGILLQAGDTRVMGREAWVLIHEGSFGAIGSVGQVEDTVEWVRMIHKRILAIFAERSKMTARQIGRKWHRKDWWLSSDECLRLGFVDEVR